MFTQPVDPPRTLVDQVLTVIDKSESGRIATRELIPVRFSRLEVV